MSTLDAQKSRLMEEIREAQIQIESIRQQPNPDLRILNYYHDVVARNRQVVESLNNHLGLSNEEDMGAL